MQSTVTHCKHFNPQLIERRVTCPIVVAQRTARKKGKEIHWLDLMSCNDVCMGNVAEEYNNCRFYKD